MVVVVVVTRGAPFPLTPCAGRIVAVPLATKVKAVRHLKLQLNLSLVGAVVFLCLGHYSLAWASSSAALLGLGLSSIFPIMMTLPAQLNIEVDFKTTGHLLVGSCLGESILPVIIGVVMAISPNGLKITVFVVSIVLIMIAAVILTTAHYDCSSNRRRRNRSANDDDCGSDDATADKG